MAVRATSSTAVGIEFPGKTDTSEDVKTYLLAIYSYADRVAVHRNVSFEKHLQTVMGIDRRPSARRSRRCRIS